MSPRDRIGRRFREDGFAEAEDFVRGGELTADVELWDLGSRTLRKRKLADIREYVLQRRGEWLDQYVGSPILMARVRADGAVFRAY